MASPAPHDLQGSTSTGVDPRTSALLCYAAWWVSGLIFLIIEQRNRTVRYHAAQSLVLFGGLTVLIGLLSVMSVAMLMISGSAFQAARILVYVVWIAAVAIWLVLMYRTLQGETWQVPLVAGLAEKIAGK